MKKQKTEGHKVIVPCTTRDPDSHSFRESLYVSKVAYFVPGSIWRTEPTSGIMGVSSAGSRNGGHAYPSGFSSGQRVDSLKCPFPGLLGGCHQRDYSLRPETPKNLTCRDKLLGFLRSHRPPVQPYQAHPLYPRKWHFLPSSVTMVTTLFLSYWPKA